MQVAGQICETCRSRWEAKNRSPKVLVAIPNTTLEHNAQVVMCPYCDSDAAIRIAKSNEVK